MKTLIIAEKPDLARNIIAGIGKVSFANYDGYWENDDYVVTNAFGHLFTLYDIEEYSPDYNPDEKHPWSFDNIPCYPSEFLFKLKKDVNKTKTDGVKKQYETIEKLVNRKDVNKIVNAGDSDREGEIIIRIILSFCNKKSKPVYRLWSNVQTPDALSDALDNLVNDSEYDNLANEGYARTYLDWMYGVNLTRYVSLKANKLLRVGRVIGCIVKTIYDRDMQIKNFAPEKYYSIVSKEKTREEIIELVSKKSFKADEEKFAQECCNEYNQEKAIVKNVEKESKTIDPGKLYSLSALQGVVGTELRLSPKDCLQIVQDLYESGYVTYPRTNTEYLSSAEKGPIKAIIKKFNDEGYPVDFRDSKTIFDDSKIESHSAICPTLRFPKENDLDKTHKEIYDIIKNRFIAVFCSIPCKVNRSTITISLGEKEEFKLTGDIMTQKGWTEFDINNRKDKVLPNLKEGDEVVINFKPIEKTTTPPKHYTVKSLNNFLTNPLKKAKSDIDSTEDDTEKYKDILAGLEIGTEATRGGIIDNAIKSGYISLKNNNYYIEPDGIYYVQTLEKLKLDVSPLYTANLNKMLKDVYKSDLTISDVVNKGKELINEVFSQNIEIEKYAPQRETIGKCPICKEDVIKTKYGFMCLKYKKGCDFALPKKVAGKTLSNTVIQNLLEKQHSNLIKGFVNSKGNKFDAFLQLNLTPKPQLKFVFKDNANSKESIDYNCPVCGAKIINDKFNWSCEAKCGFKIGYEICGKKITKKNAIDIITKGKTDLINGFISKKGKKFSAYLKLNDNKVIFSFPEK